ncbi:hypothetical protein ACSQ67_023958 [Phaseolus vulgaris]
MFSSLSYTSSLPLTHPRRGTLTPPTTFSNNHPPTVKSVATREAKPISSPPDKAILSPPIAIQKTKNPN